MASEKAVRKMVECMVTLNRKASERMQAFGAHACTDITGFGFIGHALEMVSASRVGMVIDSKRFPSCQRPWNTVGWGCFQEALLRTVNSSPARSKWIQWVPPLLIDLLYDPQTSGGLLISLPRDGAGNNGQGPSGGWACRCLYCWRSHRRSTQEDDEDHLKRKSW